MSSIITAILSKALDGLTLRSQATAQNIANVNSKGYRPLAVSFESELKTAAAKGEAAVRALPLAMHQEQLPLGQGVRMDLELENQSETAMRYGALVDVLARELQLQSAVLKGGQ